MLASKAHAVLLRTVFEMTAMVPREAHDERGATAWTSFVREVAVSQSSSERAARTLIDAAGRLCTVLPVAMSLLQAGTMTVGRCTVLVGELAHYTDALAGQIDAKLSQRAASLAPWRITQAVTRQAAVLDPAAAAIRTAHAGARRTVTLLPQPDGQAELSIFGPAVTVMACLDTHTDPPPGIDHDPCGQQPTLPDPDRLNAIDAEQATPPADDAPQSPWHTPPVDEPDTTWNWLHDGEPPF